MELESMKVDKLYSLKVLFITHYPDMYGANRSMLQLILDLKEYYGIIPIVLLPRGGEITTLLDKYQISYYIFPFHLWCYITSSSGLRFSLSLIRKRFVNVLTIFRVLCIVKKEKIDVVHSNSSVINIGAYIHWLARVPHFWHFREFGKIDYDLEYIYPKSIVSWFYNQGATKCIAISKSIQHFYSKFVHQEKIEMIYNGIKVKSLVPAILKSNSCVDFCMVGLLSPQKNQLLVLKAAHYLFSNGVTNFHVSFVGNSMENGYDEHLKTFVDVNCMSDYVSFYGYNSDIGIVLSKMDVGVIASLKEAFGRVTIEYMMYGLPVIASDSGANSELIDDNITGVLFNNNDYVSLAHVMEYMINNRERRLEMGRLAQKKAVEHFSSEKNAQLVYQLYRTYI